MLTKREADELRALAQIALPAVRRGRWVGAALPCRADRASLRSAVLRVVRAAPTMVLSLDMRLAALEYLARGGDPLPPMEDRRAAVAEYLDRWRRVMGGDPQPCCQGYAWDSGMEGRGGHHPACVNYPATK